MGAWVSSDLIILITLPFEASAMTELWDQGRRSQNLWDQEPGPFQQPQYKDRNQSTIRAEGHQSCDSGVLASPECGLGVQTIKVSFGQQAQLSRDPATGGDRQRQAGVGPQDVEWGTTQWVPTLLVGPGRLRVPPQPSWRVCGAWKWMKTGYPQDRSWAASPGHPQDRVVGRVLNLFPGGVLGGEVAYDCHLVAICCYDEAEWAGAVTSGSK